jgi:hypothetical protein
MMEDMRLRKLAPLTQASYVRSVRRLASYLRRPPDTATVEDLRNFQLHLVDRGTSPITLNATITGLKFFFGVTLDRGELMAKMKPVFVPRTRCLIRAHGRLRDPPRDRGELDTGPGSDHGGRPRTGHAWLAWPRSPRYRIVPAQTRARAGAAATLARRHPYPVARTRKYNPLPLQYHQRVTFAGT